MRHLHRYGPIAVLALLLAAGCSRAPADSAIATEIKARFFSDPLVKTAPVSVSVNKGVVTLAGPVASVNVQLQAFKLALDTEGVRKLIDKMLVAPPPEPPPASREALVSRHSDPAPKDRTPEPVTPAAETIPNPPAQEPVQVIREIVQTPPPQIQVRVVAPPPQPVVAPAAAEPVADYSAPVAVPLIETAVPPATGRRRVHSPVALAAAGAVVPAALIQKWIYGFHQDDPQAQINYQPVGSGSGMQWLGQGRTDLGAVEMPLSDAELARVQQVHVLQFPAAIGAIAPICNVGGVIHGLNLSGEVLADLFSGRITRWDDPAIRMLNPYVTLPPADVTVIHRADSSDTTFLFTAYLSAVSIDWQTRIGTGLSVRWPTVGLNRRGNEGVAELVKQTPNSIGYVDESFAVQCGLSQGSILNRSGHLVKASPDSLTAAAADLERPNSPDFRASILNAPGADAYPIAGFLWLLVPDHVPESNKKEAVRSFLGWVLTHGQSDAAQWGYAPLPKGLAAREQAQIRRIR